MRWGEKDAIKRSSKYNIDLAHRIKKKLAKENLHAFLGNRIFGPTKNAPNFLNTYPIWTSKKTNR